MGTFCNHKKQSDESNTDKDEFQLPDVKKKEMSQER